MPAKYVSPARGVKTLSAPGAILAPGSCPRRPPAAYDPAVKNDRRAAPRLRLAFPVLVEGPFGLRRCLGRDISPGGLFLETPDPYPPGERVRVIFAVPDGSWEMACFCEVRHAARIAGPAGEVRGVGLAFVGVDLAADDLITVARRTHA